MAIILKVKCADQSDQLDPYQRITHIGGKDGQLEWRHSHAQAIDCIEQDLFHYYVEKDARVLKLEVGLAPGGGKYLKTRADASHPELLLMLPECPKRAAL